LAKVCSFLILTILPAFVQYFSPIADFEIIARRLRAKVANKTNYQ
jgi:EamA domain-containing membrane protein RarD